MRNLFIEAQDVWLFRDGRPFDAGSAHRAESMFPPYPSVIQGAIRSNQLVLEGMDLTTGKHKDGRTIQQVVGDALTFDGALNLNGLTLRGPYIARRLKDGKVERLFPLPADAYYPKGGGVKSATPRRKQDGELVSDKSGLLLIPGSDAVKPSGPRWLTLDDLLKYFEGNSVEGVDQIDLFQKESRFGIGRNNEWVAKKGMLYEAEFIRPAKDVGLLVGMRGYDHAGWDNGLLQLGGEGRAAHYSAVEVAKELPSAPNPLPKYFKVYFATPTYFKNGAKPETWGGFFDGDVRLATCALRSYDSISGFDWAKKADSHEANRASRRYAPAGSVYYFENFKDGKLKADAITEFGSELGFGQFILSSSKEW